MVDRATLTLAVLGSLVLASCARTDQADATGQAVDATAATGPLVRDSAGIRIVESVVGRWTEPTTWRVSAEPVMELGAGIEGDPEHHFYGIRGITISPTGSTTVADAGSLSLLNFDSAGALLRRVGGLGDGPGEFGGLDMQRLLRCGGDSLVVVGARSTSVFTPAGEFARRFRVVPPDGAYADLRACVGNRLYALNGFEPTPRDPGVYRQRAVLGLYTNDGQWLTAIDTLPSGWWTYNRYSINEAGLGSHPTPYGRSLAVAFDGERVATGTGDTFEIVLRDSEGRLTQILRVARRERPVTAADRERFRSFVLDRPRGTSRQEQEFAANLEAELEGPDIPNTFPAFQELLFDTEGNLWVREYNFYDAIAFFNVEYGGATRRQPRARLLTDSTQSWTVFDREGVLLGEVETPAGLVVHEIGSEHIVGVGRDTLGVEYLRVYRLEKPGG